MSTALTCSFDEALDGLLIVGEPACLFGGNDCAEFDGNMRSGIIVGSRIDNASKRQKRRETRKSLTPLERHFRMR